MADAMIPVVSRVAKNNNQTQKTRCPFAGKWPNSTHQLAPSMPRHRVYRPLGERRPTGRGGPRGRANVSVSVNSQMPMLTSVC